MSMSGGSSPFGDEDTIKVKKKVNHNRVSMLNFSDEVMDQAINQEIDVFADCSDQPVAKPSRRRSSMATRRRSSMGGSGSIVSEKEQLRIAEMYKVVIQMSSENKLNEKNSWNFDLIDHLGRLIRDESKSVNFQKASCTLDASVKIYSNRVDDTYASSHRILESLSRGNQQDEDDNSNKPIKAKVGSKVSSTRLHLTDTIERNVESLNVVKLEHDYAFDPMFHKLSKAFDEGGAKGMLLYNMRVSRYGSSLSFLNSHTEDAMKAEEKAYHREGTAGAVINMADLVQRSGLTINKVNSLCLSEKLASFHEVLKRPMCELGIRSFKSNPVNQQAYREVALKPLAQLIGSPDSHGVTTTDNSPIVNNQPFAAMGNNEELATNLTHDFDHYEDDGHGLDMLDEDFVSPPSTPPPADPDARRTSIQALGLLSPSSHKLSWSQAQQQVQAASSSASDPAPAATDGLNPQEVVQNLLQLQIDPSNDYAYINLDQAAIISNHDLLNSNNAWAGARHWKYVTRSLKQPTPEPSAEGESKDGDNKGAEEPAAKKKASRGGKSKEAGASGKIAFSAALVDPKLFSKAKTTRTSEVDSTIFTSGMEEKMEEEKDLLLLPMNDEKLSVKDLCRLSTLPHVIVPPKYLNLHSLVAATQSQGGGDGKGKTENGKMVGDKSARLRGLVDSVLMINHYDDHLLAQAQVQATVGMTATGGMGGDGSHALDAGHADDFDDGYEDMGDEVGGEVDYGNFGEANAPIGEVEAPVELTGLQVDASKLVQAQRLVGKMQINYAKVSKRVNVAKLKSDLWDQIDHHIAAPAAATSQASPSTPQSLSFRELLDEAHSDDRKETVQKDASLAYYFICLLHLANEKNLKITGQEDMSDLTISQGH